jgi:WD40 repeat protein
MAQTVGPQFPAAGHKGAVNAMVNHGKTILSVGEDGFLQKWDADSGIAKERFQISALPLKAMVARPGKTEIAVIESDGKQNRVSVWDFSRKSKLFSVNFQARPNFIGYSAVGTFLFVAPSDKIELLCLDGVSGEVVRIIDAVDIVNLVATGKSERSAVLYQNSGIISYWDMEKGIKIQEKRTIPNLRHPILVGNNRFLCGISADTSAPGFFVIDAVSGDMLDRNSTLTEGRLYQLNPESSEFICVSLQTKESSNEKTGSYGLSQIYHFSVDTKGTLIFKKQSQLDWQVLCALVTENSLFFGTENGNLWAGTQKFAMLQTKEHRRIYSAAVSEDGVMLIIAQGKLGMLPVDFHDITDISFTDMPYTNITAARKGFVLWQEDEGKIPPVFSSIGSHDVVLKRPDVRFPLRSVSTLEDKALLLDAVGNISVVSLKTGANSFSFSSAGAMDAVLLDEKNILIGRGDVSGVAPFLKVNIQTGETVPIAFPASVGIKVYKGKSGALFGAVIAKDENGPKTVIVKLDLSNSKASFAAAEYPGEHLDVSFAETSDVITVTVGKEGVIRFEISLDGVSSVFETLEQGSGFPTSLIDAGNFLLSIDAEGLLAWHDPRSGSLLAQLFLFEDGWAVEENKGAKSPPTTFNAVETVEQEADIF